MARGRAALTGVKGRGAGLRLGAPARCRTRAERLWATLAAREFEIQLHAELTVEFMASPARVHATSRSTQMPTPPPPMLTPDHFNQRGAGHLPGHLGIVITHVGERELRSELEVGPQLMAPNGYLHAGALVTLADTSAGYGCVAHLPTGAVGFTTIELKSNHLGTTLDGTVQCVASAVHLGRTTHVWDAVLTHRQSGRTLALFRCTQMILYPKGA